MRDEKTVSDKDHERMLEVASTLDRIAQLAYAR
jgi:hypothetical protein